MTREGIPWCHRLSLDECAGDGARCVLALEHELDADAFQPVNKPSATHLCTVLAPAHPADVLVANALVHVIALGHLAGEPDLDILKAQ